MIATNIPIPCSYHEKGYSRVYMADLPDESRFASDEVPDYSDACSDLAEILRERLLDQPGMTCNKVNNLFKVILQAASPESPMTIAGPEVVDDVRLRVRMVVEDWPLQDLIGYAKEVDAGGARILKV